MNKKFEQFQILRFIAFFFIFYNHMNQYTYGFPLFNLYLSSASVCFFFEISGFLCGYNMIKNSLNFSVKETFTYTLKKLVKVYPLYLLTIVFWVLFSQIPEDIASFNFTDLVLQLISFMKHALLLQSWFHTGYFDYNGVAWFLSTLLFLWILTPSAISLIELISERFGRKYVVIMLFLSMVLELLYCFLMRTNDDEQFFQYICPFSRVFEYFSSILIGVLFSYYEDNPRIKLLNNHYLCTVIELIAVVVWISFAYLFKPQFIWSSRIIHWIIPNFLIILSFAIGNGLISSWSKKFLFVQLGDISFECYLLHMPILSVYKSINSTIAGKSILGNVFSVLYVLFLTIFLSYLIHYSDKIFVLKNTPIGM